MSRVAVLLTVVVMILSFAAGVAIAAQVITCTGGPCVGTNNEDTINGSPKDDTIIAKRGGDNVLSNQGGVDIVDGGRGNDHIDVFDEAGDDVVDCGRGRDDTIIKDAGDTAKRCEVTAPIAG